MCRFVSKKYIVAVVSTLILMLSLAGAGLAINMFAESLAGLGSAAFTDEVEVIKIKVKDLDEVRVRSGTTVNTVAARIYDVELFGDDEVLGVKTVTWTLAEVAAEVKKDVTFTGLALAAIDELDVDVVY